jgi:hypothetical protein
VNRDQFIQDLHDVLVRLHWDTGRDFDLYRLADPTNISGVGTVASGIELGNGTVAMQWREPHPSKVIWPTIDEVLAVHGHGGKTVVHWLDEAAT